MIMNLHGPLADVSLRRQICDYVKRRGWTVVRDPEGRIGPYAYRGNQWVSYDDVDDIRRKVGRAGQARGGANPDGIDTM